MFFELIIKNKELYYILNVTTGIFKILNKNTIERTIDLREYLAIFIRDVSTELGHFQTVIQK